MVVKTIRFLLLAIVSFAVWSLYRLGHPKPGEPQFIYRFRRHPSASPEYLAYLACGLFHPHLLRTGSTVRERADPLPGDDLAPHPLWQETRKTVEVPAEAATALALIAGGLAALARRTWATVVHIMSLGMMLVTSVSSIGEPARASVVPASLFFAVLTLAAVALVLASARGGRDVPLPQTQ